jgi:hypothetical protein
MQRVFWVFVLLVAFTGFANAEQGTTGEEPIYPRMWPGNVSHNTGMHSPFEDAVISTTRIEQGYTIFRGRSTALAPFVSFQATFDDRGWDWNNKLVTQIGLKASKTFDKGVVQVGSAYVKEKRIKSGRSDSEFAVFANYWFGWSQLSLHARDGNLFSSFPGSSWGNVGNISPVESGNVIGMAYFRQGTVLTRINRLAIVPFGDLLFKKDSDGYDWNNGHVAGIGLALDIPLPMGILEGGAAYKWEERYISGNKAEGLVWFINFWYGWNPSS